MNLQDQSGEEMAFQPYSMAPKSIKSFEANVKTWLYSVKYHIADRALKMLGHSVPANVFNNHAHDLASRPINFLITLEATIETTTRKAFDSYEDFLTSFPPAQHQTGRLFFH